MVMDQALHGHESRLPLETGREVGFWFWWVAVGEAANVAGQDAYLPGYLTLPHSTTSVL